MHFRASSLYGSMIACVGQALGSSSEWSVSPDGTRAVVSWRVLLPGGASRETLVLSDYLQEALFPAWLYSLGSSLVLALSELSPELARSERLGALR